MSPPRALGHRQSTGSRPVCLPASTQSVLGQDSVPRASSVPGPPPLASHAVMQTGRPARPKGRGRAGGSNSTRLARTRVLTRTLGAHGPVVLCPGCLGYPSKHSLPWTHSQFPGSRRPQRQHPKRRRGCLPGDMGPSLEQALRDHRGAHNHLTGPTATRLAQGQGRVPTRVLSAQEPLGSLTLGPNWTETGQCLCATHRTRKAVRSRDQQGPCGCLVPGHRFHGMSPKSGTGSTRLVPS